jgi:hypothetical protein
VYLLHQDRLPVHLSARNNSRTAGRISMKHKIRRVPLTFASTSHFLVETGQQHRTLHMKTRRISLNVRRSGRILRTEVKRAFLANPAVLHATRRCSHKAVPLQALTELTSAVSGGRQAMSQFSLPSGLTSLRRYEIES